MTREGSLFLALCVAAAIFALVFWAELFFSDPRVQQAYVAGSFLAIGWIVTFVFREYGLILQRRQRSIDVQVAIKGEIFDYSEALEDEDYVATAEAICKRVEDGGDTGGSRYHPLVPRVSRPLIFETLAEDISLLPEEAIYRVVQFYSVLSDVIMFSEDLMAESFREGEAKSRAAALRDYIDLRETSHRLAIESLEALDKGLAAQRAKTIGQILGTSRNAG